MPKNRDTEREVTDRATEREGTVRDAYQKKEGNMKAIMTFYIAMTYKIKIKETGKEAEVRVSPESNTISL